MCYNSKNINAYKGKAGIPLEWTEIKIKVPQSLTEEAEAIANMVVPYGIYVEDYSSLERDALEIAHIDLIDEDLVNKDRTVSIIHIYISSEENPLEAIEYLKQRYEAQGIDYAVDTDTVDEKQWADNWKKFFKTTRIGEKLIIRPSWEPYPEDKNAVVLSIDPGAAFGTGTHATTKMCLQKLQKYIKKGSSMLDIGSGSGILSIAAALLGAESVKGVDIDPVAVSVAKENADINGVGDKTEFIEGDLCDKISGTFDVVCANIVADVIISLLPTVGRFMHEGSVFMCSGIIDVRENDVADAFSKYGFTIIDECECENWRAFIVSKKEK